MRLEIDAEALPLAFMATGSVDIDDFTPKKDYATGAPKLSSLSGFETKELLNCRKFQAVHLNGARELDGVADGVTVSLVLPIRTASFGQVFVPRPHSKVLVTHYVTNSNRLGISLQIHQLVPAGQEEDSGEN